MSAMWDGCIDNRWTCGHQFTVAAGEVVGEVEESGIEGRGEGVEG